VHQLQPETGCRGIDLACHESLEHLAYLGRHRARLNDSVHLGAETPERAEGVLHAGGSLNKPSPLRMIDGRSWIKLKMTVVAWSKCQSEVTPPRDMAGTVLYGVANRANTAGGPIGL
jgi:hypothetical protein